jgi:hypothetical protein
VHFLIAGAMLFAICAWLNGGADEGAGSAERTVRITANEVEWLKQTWAHQWRCCSTAIIRSKFVIHAT